MNTKFSNYYLKYKKIFFVSIFVLFSMGFVFIILNSQPQLEIKTTPTEAKITVSNETETSTSETDFKKRLKKGLYNIKVEKSGFLTEERQILLNQNTKLEIKIFPSSLSDVEKSYIKENISPVFTSGGFQEGKIFGINRINGNLIKIEKGEEVVIYSGKVKSYDTSDNTAIVIDEINLNEINVINLENLNIRKLKLDSFSPITSIALSEDSTNIFFLGEFKIEDKISSLNIVPVNGGLPTKIVNTSAQSIEHLKGDVLILFTKNHEENKNDFVLYDTKQKKTLLSKLTSNYNVSPDKSSILLHRTNNIEIIDTLSLKTRKRDILESSRSAWKNNNLVYIFRNDNENLYFSKISVDPFIVEPFKLLLERKSLLEIFGFNENKLFGQDYNNEIFSISIPEI